MAILQKKKIEHWQKIAMMLVLYDIIAVAASYFLALWLRFDCVYSAIPVRFMRPYLRALPLNILISLLVFWRMKMYKAIWRFVSYVELMRIAAGTIISVLLHALCISLFFSRMPISYFVWGGILQGGMLVAIRFSYRLTLFLTSKRRLDESATRVMIIGAGETGQALIREIGKAKELNERVVCIIDDNPNKLGRDVDGIPVVGTREDILASVEKYSVKKICLALPSATAAQKRDILHICNETDCVLMQVPAMWQLASGQITTTMRKVSVDDLLGREPVQSNLEEVFGFLNGKTVLVTGGV